MDISHLVTQDNAEAGIWVEAELYGSKQGFELNILGNDSDSVQKYAREQMKKARRNAGKKELDDETIGAVLGFENGAALACIAGIRGLQFDEKHNEFLGYVPVVIKYIDQESKEEKERELKNDKESYQFLIEKIPAVKDFVLKVSGDRSNFLSGKPNS
jgi:hypothetical protein